MKLESSKYNLITILGPTATGKTRLAAHLAARINGEVISGDSRQVYKGMDIGTGKDLIDYVVDGKEIPAHLVDIEEPGKHYNVYRLDRKSTRLNSSHVRISYAVFCLKKK